jgi:hypothetical protein
MFSQALDLKRLSASKGGPVRENAEKAAGFRPVADRKESHEYEKIFCVFSGRFDGGHFGRLRRHYRDLFQ